MNGQLRKKESLGRGLNRVCRTHVENALTSLKTSHQPEALHDVRREIKKIRAVFRLAHTALGRKEYRKTAETMRLAAKPLAAARDARVTKKTLGLLVGKKARELRTIKSALETNFSHAERNFADNDLGSLAKLILKRVRKQLGDLDLKEAGWKHFRSCLKTSYTRGREACQQAAKKPEPKIFHNWRKRVKELCYQLDFLCPDWPKDSKELLNSLEQLGEALGDDHDLVLLENFVKDNCDSSKETTKLEHLVDVKRRGYRAGIRRLGSRAYAEPPDELCAKLEGDWKRWRNGR